jgi:hypothetical protein
MSTNNKLPVRVVCHLRWSDSCEIGWHDPLSVKLVSNSLGVMLRLYHFPAVCRKKGSEPPRTRTWNLEIKSLLLCQLS